MVDKMITKPREIDLTVFCTILFAGIACGGLLAVGVFAMNQPANVAPLAPHETRTANLQDAFQLSDIQSLGHGVHVFPHADFPRRLAEFIDTNSQTQVFAVCPLGTNDAPKAGFLVLTRPDPEWLKILPGSAAPPDNSRTGNTRPGG